MLHQIIKKCIFYIGIKNGFSCIIVRQIPCENAKVKFKAGGKRFLNMLENTVNSEIFLRILFLRIALNDIYAKLKIHN